MPRRSLYSSVATNDRRRRHAAGELQNVPGTGTFCDKNLGLRFRLQNVPGTGTFCDKNLGLRFRVQNVPGSSTCCDKKGWAEDIVEGCAAAHTTCAVLVGSPQSLSRLGAPMLMPHDPE